MSVYEADHAGALADIRAAGAYAPITVTSLGTYDSVTDAWTAPTTVVTAGYAIGKKGDPERYRSLSLVESAAPTLLWCPVTYGDRPSLEGSIPWGGETFKVRDSKPLAPDGTLLTADIVIAR